METVLFTFGNQKGGVGKSTLTALFASYVHYKTDKSIAVVDADDMQSTIKKWRNTDLANGLNEEDTYDVFKVASNKFTEEYGNRIYGNYDFVSLDIPGNLKQQGVVSSLVPVNLIVIPTNVTQADIDATKSFLDEYVKVDEFREKNGFEPAEKHLIFSKLDSRTVNAKPKNLDAIRKASKWPILETSFPYKPTAYGNNIRTYLENGQMEPELEPLCKEIFGLLVKVHNELNS